jgi:hypothetical protein
MCSFRNIHTLLPAHRAEHRFLTAPDAQLVTAIAGLASAPDVAADIACQVAVETLDAQACPLHSSSLVCHILIYSYPDHFLIYI